MFSFVFMKQKVISINCEGQSSLAALVPVDNVGESHFPEAVSFMLKAMRRDRRPDRTYPGRPRERSATSVAL